ncbi:MAG: hypothetical protein JSS86_22105, partial [Cyanobacteria bacterium SZAS LIN-2]|nr:hypothetical protein [Cyanobacteria bacterium SZAS LIN-2]
MFTRSTILSAALSLSLLSGGIALVSDSPCYAQPQRDGADVPLRDPLPVPGVGTGSDSADSPRPAGLLNAPDMPPLRGLPAPTTTMPSPVEGTTDDPNAAKIFGGDEQIVIKKPKLEALVSVSKRLSPYSLDSESAQNISLVDVLKATVAKNLDISIASLDTRIGKSNFWGATGKFLPDINLGYNYQYLKGKIAIPFGGAGRTGLDTPFIIA